MIDLSYGGAFDEYELLEYIRQSDRNYIIQGQKNCFLQDHTKPRSLDFWLRQFANSPDTRQANNDVIAALVGTGLFSLSQGLTCPDSGRQCQGLVVNE